MEFTVNFEFVNWWAVLLATILAFLLGGAWYAPRTFGRVGLREAERAAVTGRDRDRNIQWIFVIAFVFQWLTAGLLAAVIGPNGTIADGIQAGSLIGCFFVATAQGISAIFDKRPVVRIFVNGGFHLVSLTMMGAVIAAFN